MQLFLDYNRESTARKEHNKLLKCIRTS